MNPAARLLARLRGWVRRREVEANPFADDPASEEFLAAIRESLPGERVRGRLYFRKAGLVPRPRPRRLPR